MEGQRGGRKEGGLFQVLKPIDLSPYKLSLVSILLLPFQFFLFVCSETSRKESSPSFRLGKGAVAEPVLDSTLHLRSSRSYQTFAHLVMCCSGQQMPWGRESKIRESRMDNHESEGPSVPKGSLSEP